MLLTQLGEFGLIERIKKKIQLDRSVKQGIGDDCAVLAFDRRRYLLFTCDMLIAGVDFLPHSDPYLIGRKSLAASLSDIAACAGIPRYALISLGLPQQTSVKFVDRLLEGILKLARQYQVNIVGGDLSKARVLTVDVSMLGVVEKDYLVLRSGAEPGDIIFVSGKLGGSIYGKHLRFIPRLKEARFLVKNFKINAMIDISDGLVQDLGHILKESRAGAFLYEALIPLSKQAKNLKEAFYMGEDFELLFSLSYKEAKRLLSLRPKIFTPIGEIVEKKYGLRLIDKEGREKLLRRKGFRHF